MKNIRSLFRSLLAVALTLAFSHRPVHAQMDPKLQVNRPTFLNLYQQTQSLTNKPEILTVLDYTGSMDSVMYHSAFNNTDTSDGDAAWSLRFYRTGNRRSDHAIWVGIHRNGGYWNDIESTTLIRPDGTTVTASSIDSNWVRQGLPWEPSSYSKGTSASTWPSYYVKNWITSASHVRFTYNNRTVDLPINWTVLGNFGITPNRSAGEYRKMYNTYPLKMTIEDPTSSTTAPVEVEIDRRYRLNSATIFKSGQDGSDIDIFLNCNDWRSRYLNWIFSSTNTYIKTISSGKYGFGCGVPAYSRASAVKDAVLRTWVRYYNRVFWAFRFVNNDGNYMENDQDKTLYGDNVDRSGKTPTTAAVVAGNQRGLFLMNSNSKLGMEMVSSYMTGGSTPLTYAMANALAQFNDPKSVFNNKAIIYPHPNPPVDQPDLKIDDRPKQCMKHFLILFTDGQPNNDGGGENVATPYLGGNDAEGKALSANSGRATNGNMGVNGSKGSMNPNGTWWNIANLAAVAAHGLDSNLSQKIDVPSYPVGVSEFPNSNNTSGANGADAEKWLPFWIQGRDSSSQSSAGQKVDFSPHHPIQTMTVGVSLAGKVTDATGPKRRMFMAATFGDPDVTDWDLTKVIPFQTNAQGDKESNAVYYFDAADPDQLVKYLDRAFAYASAKSGNNSTAQPTVPFVGAGLGHEIYVGKFIPPEKGGPVWKGDLMMFPTREESGVTIPMTALGQDADINNPATATWSAAATLTNTLWSSRRIYTRLPASTTVPEPALIPFNDTASGFPALKASGLLAGSTDPDMQSNIRWMMGADVKSSTTPLPNRDTIMGDVINASPAMVEYAYSPTVRNALPDGPAKTAWTGSEQRFRILFVGSNQGLIHAFGETSWQQRIEKSEDVWVTVTQARVQELWAFLPTDFLRTFHKLQDTAERHRFMVDGAPMVYHLDVPPSGGVAGDGKVNSNERALLVFGLGEGGRSYYALDISDPSTPKLGKYGTDLKGWALRADESSALPDARFANTSDASNQKDIIKNMGLATSHLNVGRMLVGAERTKLKMRDVLFVGGGLSHPFIEQNYAVNDVAPKMGRSVLALDVWKGTILKAWDFSSNLNIGPIATGVVPFQYFPNSGLIQRAYFTDYWGGLWSLGQNVTFGGSGLNKNFRKDSSNLTDWATSARPVYKQNKNNGLITTLPSPFVVGNFYPRLTAPKVTPGTVGIALVSGDRTNPLDDSSGYTDGSPTQHRLTVVFDRQDSAELGLDAAGIPDDATHLQNMTNQDDPSVDLINPAKLADPVDPEKPGAFYLASKFGYYVNFPTASGSFLTKGIIQPMVMAGVLVYSYFKPTSVDPCTGGNGETYTLRICDVMRPVINPTDSIAGCKSGPVFSWKGVASAFGARSIVTAIQAGITKPEDDPKTPLKIRSVEGKVSETFVKPRVWRTVH